jgi:septal ring factor EnvC (AmiA/AmiB activator)
MPTRLTLRVCFVLIVACLTPMRVQAGVQEIEEQINDKKDSLQEIRRTVNQKKEILSNFENKERGILAQLQSMDKKLAFKEEQLESYDLALKKVQKEKEPLESEVEELKMVLSQFQEYLSYKVVQLYKHGSYSYVKALFSAGSYTDLLKRYRYIQIMAANEQETIESYQTVYNDLSAKQQELAEREEKVLSLQNAFKEKNKEILAKREERERLLKRIRVEKAAQQALLHELEQSSLSLQTTIDDLIRQRESLFGDFKKRKGKLSWPVHGNVITRFGKHKHEKFNTYVFSKGIDIEVRHGSKVNAVYNGTVLFADWFKGYGQMVILDHGKGFYSLYAHLSQIMVPVKSTVEQGQPIGNAGESGSLKGSMLYFEIRHHGEPQDPLIWLSRR